MKLGNQGLLDLGDQQLEYRFVGAPPDEAPTLVMLHEGLGCVGLWGDFPDRLAAATGAGVLLYSRAGYGKSSMVPLPRRISFMHEEAQQVLPRVLETIGFRRGILIGHSDGASISAIYAGSVQDHRVRGLVLMAPHFFTEDMGIEAIREAREAYMTGDLRRKLARWHDNVDAAFHTWNDVWLSPAFRDWDITEELAYIRVPILIVQGQDDRYGTLRHVQVAQRECYCPVEAALLPVGHSPHREAPEATLRVISEFVNRLLRDHHEGEFGQRAA